MSGTLVLGLGNILLSDERIDVRVVERLQEEFQMTHSTRVLDGGTLAQDLLPCVEDSDRLIVVDAVDMGAGPGTVVRTEGEEVPVFL